MHQLNSSYLYRLSCIKIQSVPNWCFIFYQSWLKIFPQLSFKNVGKYQLTSFKELVPLTKIQDFVFFEPLYFLVYTVYQCIMLFIYVSRELMENQVCLVILVLKEPRLVRNWYASSIKIQFLPNNPTNFDGLTNVILKPQIIHWIQFYGKANS
jgi:hypothetical protein